MHHTVLSVAGPKGTMSEAELHVLRARLLGGVLSKARRGELKLPLPVGLVYDALDRVAVDPDQQVQQAVHLLFRTFRRTGSAWQTVRTFREQALPFPRHVQTGPRKGELVWGPLAHNRVRQVLHNPRYAGAFCYGRTVTHAGPEGHARVERLPRDRWQVLIRDAHVGSITWAEYEENVQRLRSNARSYGMERRASPPREGPALLQGLVVCGRCGERMTVRYHARGPRQVPTYLCQREGIKHGQPICQQVPGAALDAAVAELLLAAVTPLALEVTLASHDEVQARAAEADRLRRQHVERARHAAELAQHRFLRVHPDNRLVADALEAEWNAKLRDLAEAQAAYERQRAAAEQGLADEQRAAIRDLATDLPRLWRDPSTPDRERKRLARLLVDDVTLLRGEHLTAHVRFRGGAARSLTLPLPLAAWQARQTAPAVVTLIDELLNEHTDREIVARLNERGLRSGGGLRFDRPQVQEVRLAYRLPSRFARLRTGGYLTLPEMATALGVCTATVKQWRAHGLLPARRGNDKGEYLYEPPGPGAPVQWAHKLAPRRDRAAPAESQGEGAV
jgi:hypothetical protein